MTDRVAEIPMTESAYDLAKDFFFTRIFFINKKRCRQILSTVEDSAKDIHFVGLADRLTGWQTI
jgi:hypothetical protein